MSVLESRGMEAESNQFSRAVLAMFMKKTLNPLTRKSGDSMRSGNNFSYCNEDCGNRAILDFFNFKCQLTIQCLMNKYEQLVAFVSLSKEHSV